MKFMKKILSRKFSAVLLLGVFLTNSSILVNAQSKRQTPPTTTPQGDGKKNQRGESVSGATNKQEAPKPQEKPAQQEEGVVEISTDLINVDAVVYNKKSGQIVTGLKKENFAIFEDGKKKEISYFSTPEAPITVSLVLEYSKWTETFGYYGSRGQEDGKLEAVRPVALFLTNFIKPPNDYASVIAFDIRPTPITDFTNDPQRINQTINLLLRNSPAFRETNLFDALKFTLIGGKGDSVVLDNAKESTAIYDGLTKVKAKRKALILVASGIDTFSKINYDAARKIVQEAGVPVYILGTGELFFKLYEGQLGATDGIDGSPGRLTFLQAKNTLRTFATESGGKYFPITFEGELPDALRSINALMRNQYSLGYDNEGLRDGKKHKIAVMVDVNGDGQYDNKEFYVQSRPFYIAPKS